jgi:hypothetical protein
MARIAYVIRFFRIVSPLPPLMIAAFAATTTVTAAMMTIHPGRMKSAMTPLLVLQLFACSSGFMIPARRGHYDLLLTAGESRARIATVHWMMSVLPGVLAWASVGLIDVALRRGAHGVLSSGSLAAVALVSTLPWATTVALPRFAGAIGWLVTLAIVAATVPDALDSRVFTAVGGGGSWVHATLVLLLFPPLLVGENIVGPQGWLAAPALAAAAASVVYAFTWIGHHDIALESAQ